MDRPFYYKFIVSLSIGVVFIALFSLGAFLFFRYETRQVKQMDRTYLAAMTDSKLALLAGWFDDEIHDARLITGGIRFNQQVDAYFKGDIPQQLLLETLNQIKLEHLYADLILLDTLGNLRLSTNPSLVFNDSIDRIFYEKAKGTDTGVVAELFRSTIDNRVYLDVISAVKDASGGDIGGMVFKIHAGRTLDEILTDRQQASRRVLLSLLWQPSEDRWMVYRPGFSGPDTVACWLSLTQEQLKTGLEQHLLRGEPLMQEVNYLVKPIPNVPWSLLVELDDSEGRSALRALSVRLFGLVGLFSVLAILYAWCLVHYFQGRGFRELTAKSKELEHLKNRHNLTLDVLQEAVLVADALGRIRSLNLTAESMLGLRASEVSGKMLDDVIRLNKTGTGVPLFNVQRWLQGDRAMTRVDDASLHTDRGDVLPVACSLAYLPSAWPDQDGVLLVISVQVTSFQQTRFSASEGF